MKNTILFKTKSGNYYYIDIVNKNISLCHPLLSTYIENQDAETMDYYKHKYKYLKDHGCFGTYENDSNARLSPNNILRALSLTSQVLFEVTEDCNLNCKYCGYGEFYNDYLPRERTYLTQEVAFTVLDYMQKYWSDTNLHTIQKSIAIGFYGGEPLLNFSLVESVVDKIRKLPNSEMFIFTMTTNATILDRYIDFLVKKNFQILISLDGNEFNNQYRVNKKGINSFKTVVKNCELVKEKYPNFFKTNINFNAVLHNNNNVEEIYTFIKTKFDKVPRFGELNNMGIRPDKIQQFKDTYKSSGQSVDVVKDRKILSDMFTNIPQYNSLTRIIHFFSGFVFRTYKNLLEKNSHSKFLPTGTCIPFSKKIFITAKGLILPCERIGHQYAYGSIINGEVRINCEEIANKVNNYFNNLEPQCKYCYNNKFCRQCIYNIDGLEKNHKCHGFSNEIGLNKYFSETISFLENCPNDYSRIMNEIIMD